MIPFSRRHSALRGAVIDAVRIACRAAPRAASAVVAGGVLAGLAGCAAPADPPGAATASTAATAATAPTAANAANAASASATPHLAPFSSAAPGDALPDGWRPFLLGPAKRPTRWRLEAVADTAGTPVPVARRQRVAVAAAAGPTPQAAAVVPPAVALRGEADGSASGIAHPVGRALPAGATLSWTWRIDEPPRDADPGDRDRDDSAMRVALSFEGDRSRLGARDLMLSELAQLLTGHEIPYATLVYAWAPDRAVDEVVVDARSSRIRTIVVANRDAAFGRWHRSRRDIDADFRRAFGEAPGTMRGIAVFVDGDATGSRAVGWYGDLVLGR